MSFFNSVPGPSSFGFGDLLARISSMGWCFCKSIAFALRSCAQAIEAVTKFICIGCLSCWQYSHDSFEVCIATPASREATSQFSACKCIHIVLRPNNDCVPKDNYLAIQVGCSKSNCCSDICHNESRKSCSCCP